VVGFESSFWVSSGSPMISISSSNALLAIGTTDAYAHHGLESVILDQKTCPVLIRIESYDYPPEDIVVQYE
jgi:hypothetical protein